jgi:phosphatidylglycerophosphate synthase
VALHVQPGETRQAERVLWASLQSSSDGTVDKYFNRPCGRPLSRLLIHTPVTPNQVSVASSAIGLAGACLLARGDALSATMGALLFQLSAVIDCVDGDVARMVFKESRLGKWLDLAGDQVVHGAVFIGIGVGLARSGSSAPVSWLATSAVVGALISFGIVLRGMLSGGSRGNSKLQALIDRATNRDFSVLVLLLALCNSLDWFLWMAAIGSHVFWVLLLLLQWNSPSTAAKRVEPG